MAPLRVKRQGAMLLLVLLTSIGAKAQETSQETSQETGQETGIVTPVPIETEQPTPYDDRLGRLSEVIGAVHYLRNLCNVAGEPEWRQSLQALLDAETQNEPRRKARLTAAYNRVPIFCRSLYLLHAGCSSGRGELPYRRRNTRHRNYRPLWKLTINSPLLVSPRVVLAKG
jgi:uncharacterized protein (TIGR02301 family)